MRRNLLRSTTAPPEPKLAPPGAGLPKIELAVARVLFALQRRMGSRKSFDARFNKERQTIRELVRSCDEDSGAYRIVIRRPPGLEDSSRYWSVWMTLDHLRIVHHDFVRIIGSLTKGVIPEGKVSTAAVKPSVKTTGAILPAYEESCDALLRIAAAVPDLKTTARFAHPWFGPLDAAGWHALGGAHMGIHRVQIERILQGLPATRS